MLPSKSDAAESSPARVRPPITASTAAGAAVSTGAAAVVSVGAASATAVEPAESDPSAEDVSDGAGAAEAGRVGLIQPGFEHIGDQLRFGDQTAFALQNQAVSERVQIKNPGHQHDHRHQVEGDDLARQGRAVQRNDAATLAPGLQFEIDDALGRDPVFAKDNVSPVCRFAAHTHPQKLGHSSL